MITDADFEAALDAEPDPLEAEIDAMTDEQVTLSLARSGTSPEDSRRMFERVMARFQTELAEARAVERAIEAMLNEGGR